MTNTSRTAHLTDSERAELRALSTAYFEGRVTVDVVHARMEQLGVDLSPPPPPPTVAQLQDRIAVLAHALRSAAKVMSEVPKEHRRWDADMLEYLEKLADGKADNPDDK